ncbi:MAG: hypothetical protein ABSF95_04180 [Verrucomicrobiota bacterium]|jgi:hypothetical protein
MSRNKPTVLIRKSLESDDPYKVIEWSSGRCSFGEHTPCDVRSFYLFGGPTEPGGRASRTFAENWADLVPELVANVVSVVAERKKREIEFNLLQIAFSGFETRLRRLESSQTTIIPIDSFTPEPYDLLKTILASVRYVEGSFSASWFDANIHSSGDNEEDAVSNLKSLILDFFDRLSNEPKERLGPEPARQLAVLSEYLQKRP